MLRSVLCAAAMVLLAQAVRADEEPVVFVQLGDPQLGERCDAPGFNPSGDGAACEDVHKRNLVEVFSMARAIGADFVWVMGDHTKDRSPRQKQLFREALALFPDLDIRLVIGNHDVATGSCGGLARYLYNAFDDEPRVPRPQWEVFEVRGHYFIGLDSNVWGGNVWQHCEALDDVCVYGTDAGAACETHADCGGGGVCTSWEGAAQRQKDFLVEAFDTALADPDMVRVWLAAHHTPWRASWQYDPDDFYTIHDVERCTGGEHDGMQCSDSSGKGVPYAACSQGGGVCVADPDRRYRTLVRQQMLRPGCEGRCDHFLSGHNHGNVVWQPEGGTFQFHSAAGISAMGGGPEVDPDHPLGAIVWRAWSDGRVERQLYTVEMQPPYQLGPTAGCATTPDPDGDGVGDGCDNCPLHANAGQADSDRDGYGNACDADIDQDGVVGLADVVRVKQAVPSRLGDPEYLPVLDLDADGDVGSDDAAAAAALAGQPPGPSGLACAGEIGCTLRCLGAAGDADGDGVADDCDNCRDRMNPDQRDSDFDGYGNACDPDFSNDEAVGIPDYARLRANYGRRVGDPGYDATCDLDGSASVGLGDLAIFFGQLPDGPGPSGLACAGALPCSRP